MPAVNSVETTMPSASAFESAWMTSRIPAIVAVTASTRLTFGRFGTGPTPSPAPQERGTREDPRVTQ